MHTEKPMTTSWKNKLVAYLHDPPSKALDIPAHKEVARTLLRQAGFTDEEADTFSGQPDWAASAADRLPFPSSQASGLRCHFDGVHNCFHHPLGNGSKSAATLPLPGEFVTAEIAQEIEQTIQPAIKDEGFGALPDDFHDPSGQRWRAQFFAHWRLWAKHAAERDCRFGFLPADTRIPDHTIWSHMQVVSALAGCADPEHPSGPVKPAFLKVQIGPVQDFIAQARSIRDLWSGSYLLSWLMASGLKALSAEIGPDAVIFPNLRGQPLFDLHWRDELWNRIRIASGAVNVWESLDWQPRELLTPNLPNVFLAIVPQTRAGDLGRMIADSMRREWHRIADAVWEDCQAAGLTADEGAIQESERKARFDSQVARFLSVSWQATPWPDTLTESLALADGFAAEMPVGQATKNVQRVVQMATQQMEEDHRDKRYYTTRERDQLNNAGLGWAINLAVNGWALDAVRQTRDFAAAAQGGWQAGVHCQKDSLNGRDEMVAGGREWCERAGKVGNFWPSLFKHDDFLGAATLIKRVWHRAYLERVWNLKMDGNREQGFPMPNTRGIAGHTPYEDGGTDPTADNVPADEKYFAVLALDGDEMGKWVSGERAPKFSTQLADYKDGSGQRLGAKVYFERPEFNDFLETPRPVSPGYHLQFSEALSNFALLCARPIVEAFDGRLVYAGGDDVLALLPADTALACASALRRAFTGQTVHDQDDKVLFESAAPGFLRTHAWTDNLSRPIPFLVPGPATDCSVGVAIAHFKAPLQDVIRQAQAAEKRAKRELGRSALAVTLLKHSGETLHWGCQWNSGGLDAYQAVADALAKEWVSGKFPHRLVELLEPYVNAKSGLAKMESATGFNQQAQQIIEAEIRTAIDRQLGDKPPSEPERIRLSQTLLDYTQKLPCVQCQISGIIGLCQTASFANRTRSDQRKSNEPYSSHTR